MASMACWNFSAVRIRIWDKIGYVDEQHHGEKGNSDESNAGPVEEVGGQASCCKQNHWQKSGARMHAVQ